MSFSTPNKDGEELDISKGVVASLNHAQAQPSHVNDPANWVPVSFEDWGVYERQRAAIMKAGADKSDAELELAIQSSIEERDIAERKKEHMHPLFSEKEVSTDKGKSPIVRSLNEKPERLSLEDRIHGLSLEVGSLLPTLRDPLGDTHVYVDPPAQQKEQDDETYAHYVEKYRIPMLIQKQTLLSFNSPFFEPMFRSTYQFRILRRRGLVGILPEHVKYVIDLTPPPEGDEAVYLMTELCCSEGVRRWFLANRRWQVSKSLIGGEDEYMPSIQGSKRFTPNVTTSGEWTDGVGYNPSPGVLSSQGVLVTLPLEYSPVRHRCAIERVFAAIHGQDPQLDSAPKVWTTFAVAKYFSLTHTPLTDYIISWLSAFPNSYFLEVNPETSLKIADGLECHDLCRDVFALLVGEEALATTRRCDDPTFGTQASVYGRKREDLLEPYQTRIEYASKALIERVGAEFLFLVVREMSWFESLPEFSKLALDGPLSVDAANQLLAVRSTLKFYVRGALYKLLCTNFKYMPDADQALFGDDHLFPNTPWASIWKLLRPRERILTRSFWEALTCCSSIFRGPTNLDIEGWWQKFWPITESADFEATFRENGLMRVINLNDLQDMVAKLNHRSTFISFKASDESKDSPTSFCQKLQSNQGNPPRRNLAQDITNASFDHEADANLASGPHHGEKKPSRLTDGPAPRTSPDNLSDSHSVEYPFKDVFENNSTENCLPIQQKCRLSSDSAHLNTSHAFQQPGAPLPSEAYEANQNHFFVLDKFFEEAMAYLQAVAARIMETPDASTRTGSLEMKLTNTLVSLTDAEWKFLPLWAGGNDDDSGGVFNDDVPLSYEGFSTAGPKVHTGPESNSSGSEDTFGVTSLDTFPHTSLQNHDGRSGTKVASADGSPFSSGDDVSMFEGGDPTSDKSFVLVPSVNGSSVTLQSDRTIMTPSDSEDEEGKWEKEASGLAAEMETEEGGAESSASLSSTVEFDDDDDDLDTMDGWYGEDEDEEMDGLV